MISTVLPILFLVVLGAAQSSTVSLFLPFVDPQSLVASIAGSDSTATSYVVNCASPAVSTTAAAASASATNLHDTSSDNGGNGCGFPEAITVVQGPSTVHYAIQIGNAGAESINCQLLGNTQAICTAAASGSALLAGSNSIPALTTATLSATDYLFIPVVITAGSVTAQQTGSATAKTTPSTGTGYTSGTKTGSTTSGAPTGSSSSAKTPSTNGATQGTPVFGAGVLGALGVAVAGAIL